MATKKKNVNVDIHYSFDWFSKLLNASIIPPPAQIDYEPVCFENYGQKWTTWLRRFNLWMTSAELIAKSDTKIIAKILSVAGPRVEEVDETNITDATKTFKDATTLLDTYFGPKKDTVFPQLNLDNWLS